MCVCIYIYIYIYIYILEEGPPIGGSVTTLLFVVLCLRSPDQICKIFVTTRSTFDQIWEPWDSIWTALSQFWGPWASILRCFGAPGALWEPLVPL